jgi:hypothetical protein
MRGLAAEEPGQTAPVENIKPRKSSSTTDGHGSQRLAAEQQFTRRGNKLPGEKSVFIRGHPWFMTSLADCNCRL